MVFTTASMKIGVFWYVKSCSLAKVYYCFEKTVWPPSTGYPVDGDSIFLGRTFVITRQNTRRHIT